jgi:hypothetical protein
MTIQGRFSLLHRAVVPVLWRAVIDSTWLLFRVVREPIGNSVFHHFRRSYEYVLPLFFF